MQWAFLSFKKEKKIWISSSLEGNPHSQQMAFGVGVWIISTKVKTNKLIF
jgi:hypothetical protein